MTFWNGSFSRRHASVAITCTGALLLPALRAAPAAVLQEAKVDEQQLKRLARWVALDAPTGHEHLATDRLLESLPGWERDRNGNLLRRVGSGKPRRVVACGLDGQAYAVTRIRDDGYLRLHRVGRGPRQPLWDQWHEGQQMRILTSAGPVIGVTGIANGHFAFQHRDETAIVTADDLWLDVGAASAEEVADLGVRLLDPVVRHLPPWHFGSNVAGPGAGSRVGCAAVAAAAAAGRVTSGETVFVLSTQRVFGWVGLASVLARVGEVEQLIVLGPGEAANRDEELAIDFDRRLAPVLRRARVSRVRWLAPAVVDPGDLMERVTLEESESLRALVTEAAAVSVSGDAEWPDAPGPLAIDWRADVRGSETRDSDEAAAAELLTRLVEAPAVSGHETPVREIVRRRMPDWAREVAEVDDIGNVWLAMGPAEGEATVFMAHMDEVGFEIERVAPDGTVDLRRRGGPVSSAWEGQPARVQLDSEAGVSRELNGVFLSRSDPSQKRPESLRAWFGLDASALAERGVGAGRGVTGYKEGHRIGRYRFTGRGLDDRAGTTALLLALESIDPAALESRVIFAWSVQEEVGLIGAAALAERFGGSTRRIFSVDTFVSSDTPLESPHFAHAPLGSGPVLRAIENSSMAPPGEREAIPELVGATTGIRLQLGLTQGGTDGTTFTFWGAPNAGLSWPGRYSHSPAEVLDLRDLADLARVIRTLATELH